MRLSIRSKLCAAAGACALAFAAQAASPLRAADVPRIPEGGTGFIGVTDSAGTAWRPDQRLAGTAAVTSGVPVGAGEASTWVRGQPNRDPNAPGMGPAATRTTMGGAPAPSSEQRAARPGGRSAMNPSWGTPD